MCGVRNQSGRAPLPARKARTIMAMLVATCPQCRVETNTGISADDDTIHELGPKPAVLVLCDSCRDYQRMMVENLYIVSMPRVAIAAKREVSRARHSFRASMAHCRR